MSLLCLPDTLGSLVPWDQVLAVHEVVVPHHDLLPALPEQVPQEAVPGLHHVGAQVAQAGLAGEGRRVTALLPLRDDDLGFCGGSVVASRGVVCRV